jgi:hypothetical protein
MTQPQNPNGDAKAIDAVVVLENYSVSPDGHPVKVKASYLAELGYAPASELEAVRLELEQAWQATGVASTVRGLTTLDDVVRTHREQLTTERTRAEEAERRYLHTADLMAAGHAELAAANARAGRLEEAARLTLITHGYGNIDAVPECQHGSLANLRAALSAAPQASTEQVEEDPVVRGLRERNEAADRAIQRMKPIATSPIPQAAQRSALPWDQPRTTSTELAGGDPFAKPEPGLTAEALKAQLVAALETSGNEPMKWLARELRGLEVK